MIYVEIAEIEELNKIIDIDYETVGHRERTEYIKEAIVNKTCLVAKEDSNIIGFLIYNSNFFEQCFICLIIVCKEYRKKGIGSLLLINFEKFALTEKIFSSTNKSNEIMQEVFRKNGYVSSGYIDNLDEGDPEIIFFKRIEL